MTFSPPAVPVFPAGYGPLPADFNAWVQATLGFQSQGVIFRAEQHTAQAFAAGTTIITYDTVLEDPFSGWNAGSHQWLAPFTGLYRVTLTVVVAAVSTVLEPGIEVSGTTFIFSGENQVNATLKGGASGSLLVPLIEATDFVQGLVAVSVAATASTVNGLYSTIEISYESQ